MSEPSLSEVLASEGISHQPGAHFQARDLFDVEGDFLGAYTANAAWAIINGRGDRSIIDAFRAALAEAA